MEKLAYSKKEFAKSIGVSVKTVDRLIEDKKLKVKRLKRRVLIPATEVHKFMEVA